MKKEFHLFVLKNINQAFNRGILYRILEGFEAINGNTETKGFGI
ncbi:hypothetical protein [Mesobacillus foraminis]|nr:hypothetical protein [Mesobacillus foraminis]